MARRCKSKIWHLGMRFKALVIHKAVGQCSEKEVKKKAAKGDDEPQAEQLPAPVVGRGGRQARERENALV
jgi:hypothetical protein